ncbi:MAG: HEPN domain-containing protein [Ignavibacteria bacterium]|jgi:HEPN domain-containing protein|nr:HEPN domain-containing protein [Ignavibacteria bacterium]
MTENNFNLDVDAIVKHWVETSDKDFETMLALYDSKAFGWALFLGHISTEKLLKALYVKKIKEHAPFTHNLYRLSELIGIEVSAEYSDWLDEITSFNINARYDDYKKEFYKLCTLDYTKSWIDKIKILRIWIKEKL